MKTKHTHTICKFFCRNLRTLARRVALEGRRGRVPCGREAPRPRPCGENRVRDGTLQRSELLGGVPADHVIAHDVVHEHAATSRERAFEQVEIQQLAEAVPDGDLRLLAVLDAS